MKLLFRQRVFSWFDSYDIYNEAQETVYTVKGRLSLGRCLEIYDQYQQHIGTVKQQPFTFLPRFSLYLGDTYAGEIQKEFSPFSPSFVLDCYDWRVEGDFWGWDYQVISERDGEVMRASKELLSWGDTYEMEIFRPQDALLCLMVVLAIDATKSK